MPTKRVVWLVLAARGGLALLLLLGEGDSGWAQEEISPQPEMPQKHGLTSHATPEMDLVQPATDNGRIYVPLYRLTEPFYNNILAVREPATPFRLDPSTYREVNAYLPPLGLQPVKPADQLVVFQPFAGISQSYDSNIQQTSSHHIGDFFITPRVGADLQIGTADSVYNEGYNTILALKASYELWGDIFTTHQEFNALDQQLQLEGRIGRDNFILRPFLNGQDITGSNLLMVEREGRIERQRLNSGVMGAYRLDPLWGINQTLSHSFFEHPDEAFIDFETFQAYQELTYRMFRNDDFFAWSEYQYTDASRGADGRETMGGIGWRGKPDPRLFSEVVLGWDSVDLTQSQPGRRDESGVHLSGHTSFEWGPRLRLVLKYDRSYIFNEIDRNDNYTASVLQFAPEIFLGGNWYMNPYLGVSYDEFETSRREAIELRPELEVAYLLPSLSKIFVKIGYQKYSYINRPDPPIEIYRFNAGFRWQF